MICPRTGRELKTIMVGKVALEVSPGCAGVFFDNRELQYFDEAQESNGAILAEHLSQFHVPTVDTKKRINCPKCVNVVMMRRYSSPQKVLEIDECPQCGGIWLDAGELITLRANYLTEAQREGFRKELIAQIERDPEVAADRQKYDATIGTIQRATGIIWSVFGVRR
jgi:uncharacterized protein